MSPTIYLLTILGFLIVVICYRIIEDKWIPDVDDFLGTHLIGAVVGFFVGTFTWLIIGLMVDPPARIEYAAQKKNLVSLKDNQDMHGRFYLGSGIINQGMCYYGYEDLGSGRYKMIQFSANSIIAEDLDTTQVPYFVEIRTKADTSDNIWKYDKWMAGPMNIDRFDHWEIHVPKGSVLKDAYQLNLE